MTGWPQSEARDFIFAVAAALTAAVTLSCRPAPEPLDYNVILISVDTLRADRLNCYGYEAREVSPNMDKLAEEGILFEHHCSSSPWTLPSHTSLLTGLFPSAHGVTQSGEDAVIGLVADGFTAILPDEYVTLAEAMVANGFRTAAFTGGVFLAPKFGLAQGFETFESPMLKLNDEKMQGLYKWIAEAASGRFFLFFHTFEIHVPYLDTRFLSEFLPGEGVARLRMEFAKIARDMESLDDDDRPVGRFTTRQVQLLQEHSIYTPDVCDALYVGGIARFDRWFGELVAELKKRGVYDNSLIVLTSDHGEEFSERDPNDHYGSHGNTVYEEQLRIPLIIKLPKGRHAGTRVESLVRNVDIMPTILDMLAITRPRVDMQGQSLRPLWEGSSGYTARVAVSECTTGANEKKSIRTQRYKYIFTIDMSTVQHHGRTFMPEKPEKAELYDLQVDPAEHNNLLARDHDAEMADLAKVLEGRLRNHVNQRKAIKQSAKIDDKTLDQLRALGYVK